MDGVALFTVLLGVSGGALLILRIFGAWMFRIDDVISQLKEANERLKEANDTLKKIEKKDTSL